MEVLDLKPAMLARTAPTTLAEHHPDASQKVVILKCCCCGGFTRGRQFSNQDLGFGLGACCVEFVRPRVDDMEATYGVLGVHYFASVSNRWKWQSPEIMMLTGDLHASRWFPDEENFTAQYHWRLSKRMAARPGGVTETTDFEGAMRQRIKAMPADKEKRLEEAVEGGMKNATTTKHELEYSDLCMD